MPRYPDDSITGHFFVLKSKHIIIIIRSPVIRSPVIQFPIIWYPVIRYPVIQYLVIRYPVIQYLVIRSSVIRSPVIWSPVIRSPVIWYPVIRYPGIWYPVIQYPVIWYPVIRYPDDLITVQTSISGLLLSVNRVLLDYRSSETGVPLYFYSLSIFSKNKGYSLICFNVRPLSFAFF